MPLLGQIKLRKKCKRCPQPAKPKSKGLCSSCLAFDLRRNRYITKCSNCSKIRTFNTLNTGSQITSRTHAGGHDWGSMIGLYLCAVCKKDFAKNGKFTAKVESECSVCQRSLGVEEGQVQRRICKKGTFDWREEDIGRVVCPGCHARMIRARYRECSECNVRLDIYVGKKRDGVWTCVECLKDVEENDDL